MDDAIERLMRQATLTAQDLFDRNRVKVREVCRKNRLSVLVAFGSRVREDRAPGSDLDHVTNLPPGTTLFDVARIQDELTQAFGCNVDIGSVPARIPA